MSAGVSLGSPSNAGCAHLSRSAQAPRAQAVSAGSRGTRASGVAVNLRISSPGSGASVSTSEK